MKNKKSLFTKKIYSILVTLVILCCFAYSQAVSAIERPNIIIIYSDDQGWGDVGYHGYDDIITPAIDRIANEGVAFTQGYVSASVCGPSRSGLLTGVYQQRFGCGENASMEGFPNNTKWPNTGIPRSQSTISDLLKNAGYNCAMIGKWHVGHSLSQDPNARGFDYFYGFLNGAHDYNRWLGDFSRGPGLWPLYRNRNILPATKDIYLTDLFSDEAVDFIDRATIGKEPFFLYLAYNAVHHPWQVLDNYLDRTKNLTDNVERNFFAAMVLAMDDGIGRILDKLEEKGIADNTMIWFMSDNGSPKGQGLSNNSTRKQEADNWTRSAQNANMSNAGPFRGFKGDTYEGGIRVPFCMRWPGKIPAGIVYELPVSNLDIMPSSLAPLGIYKPESGHTFDGVNLLPYIIGNMGDKRPHETLYWRRDTDYAIRQGDWKLTWNDASGPLTIMLFNLADDPEERINLVDRNPKKAQELQDLFDEWDHTMPAHEIWGAPWNRNWDFAKGRKVDVALFNKRPPTQNTARKKIK